MNSLITKFFPAIVSIALLGVVLSSCGKPEPKFPILVKFIDSTSSSKEFEKWVSDLAKEHCQCKVAFESEEPGKVTILAPASKTEVLLDLLGFWSGEKQAVAVNFFEAHPDQINTSTAVPGYRWLPYRDDKERKGHVAELPVTDPDPLGITRAQATFGPNGWSVNMDFDPSTSAVIDSYTKSNVGKQVAIVLNSEILSMPVIREPFSTGCQISGDFTPEEAKMIARGLENPPPLKYHL